MLSRHSHFSGNGFNLSILPIDLVIERTEFGRSAGRNTNGGVIDEFKFTS